MFIILAIVSIILSLLLVVGVHEAGHAIVARLFNIKIKTISIGFGKAIFRWRRPGGSEWVWSLWPVGGYVQLLNTRISPVQPAEFPYAFDKKPVWIRCLVLLSGALANFIIAWCALVFMLMLNHHETQPVIAKVIASSPASKAGLIPGDRIQSINGQIVSSWRGVGMQLLISLGEKEVTLGVDTKTGSRRSHMIDLSNWDRQKPLIEALGIFPDVSIINKHHVLGINIKEASIGAFTQLKNLTYFYLIMLKKIVTGMIPFMLLLGPIGLFTAMMGTFIQGLSIFLYFIANLSIAVALANLLPIPGLDGGSIIYALVEKIRKKPVSIAMEILLQQLAFIAFCVLTVHLLNNDIYRYLHS